MAQRSRSRGDVPAFSQRAFAGGRLSTPTSSRPVLPAFVARCPELALTARGGQPSHGPGPCRSVPAGAARPAEDEHASATLAPGPAQRAGLYASLGASRIARPPTRASTTADQQQSSQQRRPAQRKMELVPLPGLREGAPGRLGSRPAPRSLETEADRAEAMNALTEGFYAASSGSAVRARRSCYGRILALWGLTPQPLTIRTVLCLAAGLKARRYRSAASVLSQLRVDSERHGEELTPGIRRAFTDGARSCRRGLGPAVTARALCFERLAELPSAPHPWASAGPVGPAAAMIIGSWWLLRETEASNLRATHVQFRCLRGTPTAPARR